MLVEKLVDFVASIDDRDLPEITIYAAKVRLIDSVGVSMAARDAPSVVITRSMPRTHPITGQTFWQ